MAEVEFSEKGIETQNDIDGFANDGNDADDQLIKEDNDNIYEYEEKDKDYVDVENAEYEDTHNEGYRHNKTITTKGLNANSKSKKRRFDPDSIQFETHRKRVSGKIIDKFWQPLDNETLLALNKIIEYCIIKSLGRFSDNTKYKIAQKYLIKSWILEDTRAFSKRIQITNLPKITGMHNTSARNEENRHILDYDELKHRISYLETYLNAELKQLNELKNYYNQLNLNYVSDLNYYNEFQKTLETTDKKLQKERNERETLMNLHNKVKADELDNIGLIKDNAFTVDPSDDLADLLNVLHANLTKFVDASGDLLDVNERLQCFQTNLEMME